jgi:hypothetical protein
MLSQTFVSFKDSCEQILSNCIVGPGVTQWLRHCTTKQKVLGSIPVVSLGIFSVASENPKCPGLTKNEYHDTPEGKEGRCVWLTTYHLQVPMSWNLGALTSQNPLGL